MLGYCFYKLEAVAYLMRNPFPCSIISINGSCVGNLSCDVIPYDEDGNEFEDVPEHPSELIGQPLNFKVYIKEANELPENFCKGVQVEYSSFHDNAVYKTKVFEEKTKNPIFEEYIEHHIEYLTKEDLDYLENENVKFK